MTVGLYRRSNATQTMIKDNENNRITYHITLRDEF
jgi:hypothetical protein